jgi:hypothetical protein
MQETIVTRLRADPYRDLGVVDERAPRSVQATVALGAIVTLATGWWPIVAVLALQLVVGLALGRRYCLPCVIYFEFIQPRIGEGQVEDARPPRFANIIGAIFLGASAVAFASGAAGVGYALTAIVAVLALLAATTGLCVGARPIASSPVSAACGPAISIRSTSSSSMRSQPSKVSSCTSRTRSAPVAGKWRNVSPTRDARSPGSTCHSAPTSPASTTCRSFRRRLLSTDEGASWSGWPRTPDAPRTFRSTADRPLPTTPPVRRTGPSGG